MALFILVVFACICELMIIRQSWYDRKEPVVAANVVYGLVQTIVAIMLGINADTTAGRVIATGLSVISLARLAWGISIYGTQKTVSYKTKQFFRIVGRLMLIAIITLVVLKVR